MRSIKELVTAAHNSVSDFEVTQAEFVEIVKATCKDITLHQLICLCANAREGHTSFYGCKVKLVESE